MTVMRYSCEFLVIVVRLSRECLNSLETFVRVSHDIREDVAQFYFLAIKGAFRQTSFLCQILHAFVSFVRLFRIISTVLRLNMSVDIEKHS